MKCRKTKEMSKTNEMSINKPQRIVLEVLQGDTGTTGQENFQFSAFQSRRCQNRPIRYFRMT
jgi:hypothetical protein